MGFDAIPPATENAAHERELCCFFGLRLRTPPAEFPQLQPTVFRPNVKHPRLQTHPNPCC